MWLWQRSGVILHHLGLNNRCVSVNHVVTRHIELCLINEWPCLLESLEQTDIRSPCWPKQSMKYDGQQQLQDMMTTSHPCHLTSQGLFDKGACTLHHSSNQYCWQLCQSVKHKANNVLSCSIDPEWPSKLQRVPCQFLVLFLTHPITSLHRTNHQPCPIV